MARPPQTTQPDPVTTGGPSEAEAGGILTIDLSAIFDNYRALAVKVMPTECAAPKVLICHIPLGNPANAHNICVAAAAVIVHEAQHGDTIGGCQSEVRVAPVCLPLAGACTSNGDCCSDACNAGECIDRI